MGIEIMTVQAPIQSSLNPSVMCCLRQASDYMMAGDYAESLMLYDKVIELEPHNSHAFLNKGNVLDILGNYADAIKCYDSAIECDPYNAEAWYNRGMTLKKIGAVEEGLCDIRKGISLSMGEI